MIHRNQKVVLVHGLVPDPHVEIVAKTRGERNTAGTPRVTLRKKSNSERRKRNESE